jgi:hypothetical protein
MAKERKPKKHFRKSPRIKASNFVSNAVIPTFDSVENLSAWYWHKKKLMLGVPIERMGSTIPWGYKEEPNKKLFQPVDKNLQALYKAGEYLKNCSIREVCDWLFNVTGERLSATGLVKIIETRLPDSRIFLPLEERLKAYEEL